MGMPINPEFAPGREVESYTSSSSPIPGLAGQDLIGRSIGAGWRWNQRAPVPFPIAIDLQLHAWHKFFQH
jgi:hypothetical protein